MCIWRHVCWQNAATPRLVPASALSTTVCRTLSPLEPDVPEFLAVWDTHHRINESTREGGEENQSRIRRGCRVFGNFTPEISLSTDFFTKSCVDLLIVFLRHHLLLKSRPDMKLRKWRGALKQKLWSHMWRLGNFNNQHPEGNSKTKMHWPLYVKFYYEYIFVYTLACMAQQHVSSKSSGNQFGNCKLVCQQQTYA